MFGSNDYLGLGNDPAVLAGAREALERHGAGSGMNPLLGITATHRALEDCLREFTGCEDVLLFNSCTSANVAVISTLVGPSDVVISDSLNHASIIDGCRLARGRTLVYKHADANSLRDVLGEAMGDRLRLVVTDGVFSMEGECAPIPDILDAVVETGSYLVVDESHAAGVIGRTGRGTREHFGISPQAFIQTGTLAKAFGSGIGGYVAASRDLIAYLRMRARFYIFTSGIPAMTAGAALAALRLLRDDSSRLERLRASVAQLRVGLQAQGFSLLGGEGPIVPILVGSADRARRMSEVLLAEGVYVPAFGFPIVAEDAARLRVQVSSAHTPDDIAEAVSAMAHARALDRLG